MAALRASARHDETFIVTHSYVTLSFFLLSFRRNAFCAYLRTKTFEKLSATFGKLWVIASQRNSVKLCAFSVNLCVTNPSQTCRIFQYFNL